jgi:hypothetical protein
VPFPRAPIQASLFAASSCVLVLDFYLTQAASSRLKSNRAATLSAAASALAVGKLRTLAELGAAPHIFCFLFKGSFAPRTPPRHLTSNP